MGRVVQEQRIGIQFDQQLNQGLVRSAAARESGLELEEFEERLQARRGPQAGLAGRGLRVRLLPRSASAPCGSQTPPPAAACLRPCGSALAAAAAAPACLCTIIQPHIM